ncbi:nucleotide sugar dehydrogenase [Geodermatophilus maliterrae]|uniref:Nucleotide sugar dehydrogenase n=1 Tax=Geodermatophilus maliterrae TaxID=3162531 RepID=A0ABV3XHI3_9ACTN
MPPPIQVAVVGLGYVGTCVAATLAGRGLDVVGVDVDRGRVGALAEGRSPFAEAGLPELLSTAIGAGRLRLSTSFDAVESADVVLLTVGTPVRADGALAAEQLTAASREVGRRLRPGQLVVVKSTVPAGTVRSLVLPLLHGGGLAGGRDFALAFTPERLSEGTALRDLRTFPIVTGGLTPECTRAAAHFWRSAIGADVIPVDSLEAAEIVKLASNWWLDLNIALANELAKFTALYDVDVLDVIRATNTMPEGSGLVNILRPSVGVGGSCLTKDPLMVHHSARERGLEILTVPAGRAANDSMPAYTAQLVVDELTKLGKDPATSKVAVLGLAFKNGTGDLRATPTLGVVSRLVPVCGEVALHDPLVDAAEGERVFGQPLVPALADAVRGADCVAVLALHPEFRDIDFAALPVTRPCLVLDGRAHYPKQKIAELRGLGYHYRGIGR